jgi:hypothetical protein
MLWPSAAAALSDLLFALIVTAKSGARGRRPTQTFIAALRDDRLDAPWLLDAAMNRELFERHVAD